MPPKTTLKYKHHAQRKYSLCLNGIISVSIIAFSIFGTLKISYASGGCGDGACNFSETCYTCAFDCGACFITWGDATGSLSAGVSRIRESHITELRTEINSYRARCSLPPAAWTNPSLSNIAIRAVHMTQLRTAVNDIYVKVPAPRPLPFGAFTDSTITAGSTRVRLTHLTQLRTAIEDASCCGDGQCDLAYENKTSCSVDCECVDNADCDDGVFCNGAETCMPLTLDCIHGIPPPVIDGGWSAWSAWSPCAITCTQSRTRTCTNPPPSCGADCVGSDTETLVCCGGACAPVCGLCGCEAGEDCDSCTLDCGVCPVCGLFGCETALGETCNNCTLDCGFPDVYGNCPFCGDSTCNGTETCLSCALDCGVCGGGSGGGS